MHPVIYDSTYFNQILFKLRPPCLICCLTTNLKFQYLSADGLQIKSIRSDDSALEKSRQERGEQSAGQRVLAGAPLSAASVIAWLHARCHAHAARMLDALLHQSRRSRCDLLPLQINSTAQN